MTFEDILRHLSPEDQKIVADIMLLYEDIDRQTSGFALQTGLRCEAKCSQCCQNPDIETTVAEVLPVAVQLWAEGQAERYLEAIHGKDYRGVCIFYQPKYANVAPGCCRRYAYRPGLCRLFGFCARRDKYGRGAVVTCKIIKAGQGEVCSRAQEQLHQGLAAPLVSLHTLRVADIDPASGRRLLPINQAISLALEKVGFVV